MQTFNDFIAWEGTSRDTIDFKRIYADITGDTLAGLVLSQIIYWHLPSKTGGSKLRIQKEGQLWLACSRAEWWESTRLSPRQVDRVLEIIVKVEVIEKRVYRFNGSPTTHIRILEKPFLSKMQYLVDNPLKNPYLGEMEITKPLNPIVDYGEIQIAQNVRTLTESTAKTTTENKDIAAKAPRARTDADLLATSLEIEVQSPKDWKLFGKLARELKEAGIDVNCYPEYVAWVKVQSRAQGNWDVTPNSLTSNARPATYLAQQAKPKPATQTTPRKAPVNLDMLEGK